MKFISLILLLFLFYSPSQFISAKINKWHWNPKLNDGNPRPIIGILSQRLDEGLHKKYQWAGSYIAASYVKYLEMAGARAVPILNQGSDYYYEDLFNNLNGLLIPGGSASLDDSGYAKAATKLYNMAVEANQKGDYFPIWGTCLGFEMLSVLMAGQQSWLTNCDAYDIAMALNLKDGGNLFKNAPPDIMKYLSTLLVTANYHHRCLTPENVTKSGLDGNITVISTNQDKNKLEFVSTFEAKQYPFYAVQWHPEKNPFEWTIKLKNIPHFAEAIQTAQYMANFFVSEARKSKHQFHKVEDEDKALIYNYPAYFTQEANTTFTQVYLFHNNTQL